MCLLVVWIWTVISRKANSEIANDAAVPDSIAEAERNSDVEDHSSKEQPPVAAAAVNASETETTPVFVIEDDSDGGGIVMPPQDENTSLAPVESRDVHPGNDSQDDSNPIPPIVNSSQLYIVYQLQSQIETIRNSYIQRGLQCDELQLQVKQLQLDKVVGSLLVLIW